MKKMHANYRFLGTFTHFDLQKNKKQPLQVADNFKKFHVKNTYRMYVRLRKRPFPKGLNLIPKTCDFLQSWTQKCEEDMTQELCDGRIW
jgi:hypothetical protein